VTAPRSPPAAAAGSRRRLGRQTPGHRAGRARLGRRRARPRRGRLRPRPPRETNPAGTQAEQPAPARPPAPSPSPSPLCGLRAGLIAPPTQPTRRPAARAWPRARPGKRKAATRRGPRLAWRGGSARRDDAWLPRAAAAPAPAPNCGQPSGLPLGARPGRGRDITAGGELWGQRARGRSCDPKPPAPGRPEQPRPPKLTIKIRRVLRGRRVVT
jgi:hypothetical protein